MKHLFWVHSHSLYLTARGVINKLQLPYKDVIFFLGGHYKPYDLPEEIAVYDYLSLHFDISKSVNTKRQVKELDELIEELVGEDFTLYIPHIVLPRFQAMATNKHCADVKFVQEGIIDRCAGNKSKIKILKTLISKTYLHNSGRVWNTDKYLDWDFCPPGVHVSETFAISDGLFSNMGCKHTIIRWPGIKLPLELEDGAVYFVFDSLVEDKDIERKIYMGAAERMIMKYGKAGACNYVKFHPRQKLDARLCIKYLFLKNGFNVKVLPDTMPFEAILASKEHMEVCGFTSSLIFFSALMPQHKAHICVSALYQSEKFVKDYWGIFESHLARCYGDRFKFEALDDDACAETEDAQIEFPHGVSYARVDIKNEGSSKNNIRLLEVSDPSAVIDEPKWMRKKGSGRMIKSDQGSLSVKFKCMRSGNIEIALRGADLRGKDGKRVPLWVNYTKFCVDGEPIFDAPTPIWHDKPYKLELKAKNGQCIEVYSEWERCTLSAQ